MIPSSLQQAREQLNKGHFVVLWPNRLEGEPVVELAAVAVRAIDKRRMLRQGKDFQAAYLCGVLLDARRTMDRAHGN